MLISSYSITLAEGSVSVYICYLAEVNVEHRCSFTPVSSIYFRVSRKEPVMEPMKVTGT